MATTWGSNSWGDNSWASDFNVIDVNGISASFDLGTPVAYPSIGWGGQVWGNGEWGELDSPEVIPTSFSLSANLGSPSITAEVNVGWSAKTWGYPEGGGWGNLFDVVQTVSGFDLTANQGDETITNEINVGWSRNDGWGTYAWGIAGQVLAADFPITANLNSVTVDNEINIGWGSDTWGFETWGISGQNADVTGIELSGNLGSLTVKADASTGELTGEPMTVVVDDVEAFSAFVAEVTGQPMTMTLQYQEAVVDVTGQELTANDGTADLDANTIVEISATSASTWNGPYAWGSGAYGNEQVTTLAMAANEGEVDPGPDANITGIEMTATLDDVVTQGDANTGVITDIAWGEQAWGDSTWGNGKYFDATGYAQAFTISLGTAELEAVTIAAVTGQELTMQEGDETVTGNAKVLVTGNVLTMASGSLKTLIWNEVNTGTAPIVPPGWQEVDTAA